MNSKIILFLIVLFFTLTYTYAYPVFEPDLERKYSYFYLESYNNINLKLIIFKPNLELMGSIIF